MGEDMAGGRRPGRLAQPRQPERTRVVAGGEEAIQLRAVCGIEALGEAAIEQPRATGEGLGSD